MKSSRPQMSFKPKDIMMAVADEPNSHKYRLGVYAVVMIGVATTYQAYFDSVAYRAGIMQNEALAGERKFIDYYDPLNREIWQMRKTLAVLEQKPLKEIKYLTVGEGGRGLGQAGQDADDGLVDRTYLDNWVYTENYALNADGTQSTQEVRAYTDGIIYSGPNGDPKADTLYFTESYDQKTKDMTIQEHNRQVKYETDPIGYSTDRYNEWLKMRENTIWYDTAGCLGSSAIGMANVVDITPSTARWNQTDVVQTYSYIGQDTAQLSTSTTRNVYVPTSGWWAPWNGRDDQAYLPRYEQSRPAVTKSADIFQAGYREDLVRGTVNNAGFGYVESAQRWDTQLSVEGKVDYYDEDLYRDMLKDFITMVDDCDIDCQQKGSGLSVVSALLAIPYAMFGLTGIMMLLGNVTAGCRVGAIFCTICSGCVLFIMLIVSATMLFSNYSAVCMKSMTKTAGDGLFWHMADDFRMVVTLWATSWIWLMCFCCCGCANTVQATK